MTTMIADPSSPETDAAFDKIALALYPKKAAATANAKALY